MLKSMTGFGRGEYSDKDYRFTVEIKSVNHRYNEIALRMPKIFYCIEDKIRKTIDAELKRGRIDVYITVDEFKEKERTIKIDKELAIAYHKSIKELAQVLNISSDKDNVYQISKYQDILKLEEKEEDINLIWPKLEAAIKDAICALMNMRQTEGNNIYNDLTARLDTLENYISQIEERAPKIINEHREKILTKIRDLLASVGSEPDEGRLLTEAAIYAEKTNITEELVRLASHIKQFRSTLNSEESIGRKLDFIIQEINRETNTISSKANDFEVSNFIVEIKSEIEKIREQIQNIE